MSTTITQYGNAAARAAISLTTTGTSGAATYSSTTGVFNIPNYGSALSNYVSIGGTETITGAKTFTNQIVLKESTAATDYTKGLIFPNNPYGGAGDSSGLRIYPDLSVGAEAQVLELYVKNDVPPSPNTDRINFAAPNNNLVTINNNRIWNVGNLPNPVDTGSTQTISGQKSFTSNLLVGTSTDNGSGAKLQVSGASTYTGNLSTSGVYSGRTTNGQAFGTSNGVDSDFGIFVQTGNIAFTNTGTSSGFSFALGGSTKFSISNTVATFANSVKSSQFNLSALNTAPASATATGTTGEIRITSTFIYVCTATNTWVRASLSTW